VAEAEGLERETDKVKMVEDYIYSTLSPPTAHRGL
jgi:hypothetical protein